MLLFCCYSHRVRPSLSYIEQVQAAVDPFFFKQIFFLRSKRFFRQAENKSIPWRKAEWPYSSASFFTCMLGRHTDMRPYTGGAPPHTHTPLHLHSHPLRPLPSPTRCLYSHQWSRSARWPVQPLLSSDSRHCGWVISIPAHWLKRGTHTSTETLEVCVLS